MRKTTVRPSQQSLEGIPQAVQDLEARLGKTVETVKGINVTVKGMNAKLDKTIEKADGLDKKLNELDEKLDKLANLIAIFTAAPNTTFERAKL